MIVTTVETDPLTADQVNLLFSSGERKAVPPLGFPISARGGQHAMATKDYYLILGVSRTESESGIREAFRELAKRYHPDRVGPQSTRSFQDILEAYQFLSDPERRKHYNQGLHHAEGRMEVQPEPISVGQWPRPEPLVPEPLSVLRDFQTIHPSFEALFERFLRNFTGLGSPKAEPLEGLKVELRLSAIKAASGSGALL